MMRKILFRLFTAAAFAPMLQMSPALASPEETLDSVVSVLPVWPGRAQGGASAAPGVAPEGSGVVVSADGVIATAWHVVEPAKRIDVRLADGRVLPASLIGQDPATDIALLKIEASPPPFETAPRPKLASPVCAVGNAYGLGLSVTCGVVSARAVTEAGFNAVEDFIQTDAAANPGSSGGALVDETGRLVGMVSAIFASKGDGDIGVNFAVSSALLMRVTDALLEDGAVAYPSPQWRLEPPDRAQLAIAAGAVIADLAAEGPAAAAGALVGDLIVRIADRPIRKPRDAVAALALVRPDAGPVEVVLLRDGLPQTIAISLSGHAPTAADREPRPAETETDPTAQKAAQETARTAEPLGDCPHPAAVCRTRQAVFPVSSFNPLASATRIGPDLLVTNRHVIGDRGDAVVFTPAGPRGGAVVASAYLGDLALIMVPDLPEDGVVLGLDAPPPDGDGPLFVIGADVARQEVRVFAPGRLLAAAAEGAPLGRLHTDAVMQPGVSGGALLNDAGALVGIAVGGGDGRYEAIPIEDVRALLSLREEASASRVQAAKGEALARCAEGLEAAQAPGAGPSAARAVAEACAATTNKGQYLEAGRFLARAGDFDGAIGFHSSAVEQAPNSINARLSLLVSMQLGGRFPEMIPHARWLLTAAPDDPQALRFAIQSGVWGGDVALAEEAYSALEQADPRQAQAARRFIDAAPPTPPRR